MPVTIWTLEIIQQGIERFFTEQGHYPTSIDFDECVYLPSSRQVQRKFGGMESLRAQLNLTETNYTKGKLRRAIYSEFAGRSLAAEDTLEIALIAHFGEPYVHTQKRYYRLMKNRWDFFVYHRNGYFGVDIFSTTRRVNVMKNVHHKLHKYADVPASTPIYFVVDVPNLTNDDIQQVTRGSEALAKYPNITVLLLDTFLAEIIPDYKALDLPEHIKLVLMEDIEQN